MIEARNLSRSFNGLNAVADLSFSVPEGKLCAILGPNGAGKTTTIRMLLGLLPMSSGTARRGHRAAGEDRAGAELRSRWDCSPRRRASTTGSAAGPTSSSLDACTASRRRRFAPAPSSGSGGSSCGMRATALRHLVQGMKQRLALIRAVLHEPPVIFWTSRPRTRRSASARDVRSLIAGFRAEGRTILLCTHNLQEAEQLADLIGVMRRRMLVFDPATELTAGNPASRWSSRGTGPRWSRRWPRFPA